MAPQVCPSGKRGDTDAPVHDGIEGLVVVVPLQIDEATHHRLAHCEPMVQDAPMGCEPGGYGVLEHWRPGRVVEAMQKPLRHCDAAVQTWPSGLPYVLVTEGGGGGGGGREDDCKRRPPSANAGSAASGVDERGTAENEVPSTSRSCAATRTRTEGARRYAILKGRRSSGAVRVGFLFCRSPAAEMPSRKRFDGSTANMIPLVSQEFRFHSSLLAI